MNGRGVLEWYTEMFIFQINEMGKEPGKEGSGELHSRTVVQAVQGL